VVEAQQQAEDAVSQHEDEIRRIKETHTSQLRRLKASTVKSPGLRTPSSPLLRSPKLEWTSVRRLSASDASKTESLEKRVSELERALTNADDEMSEVVGRMNAAQIEVLELQTER
jgi:chromosome segregation ATPase